MSFTGFHSPALDFYDDLEVDNTKAFWEAHRDVYRTHVRGPMEALTGELSGEFGTAKVFRPYRDVRFAKDKTPYKTHQGAFVAAAPATGWYVELSARGVRFGAGCYDASPAMLARIRAAIDEPATGKAIETMVADLAADGWEVGGDRVKTAPRGYPTDHPRIELLRHKQFFLSRSLGFEPEVIGTPELVDEIRLGWRELSPFVDWLTGHAG